MFDFALVALRLRPVDLRSGRRLEHTEHYETMILAIPVSRATNFPIHSLISTRCIVEAWLPYMKQYTSILSKHQITNGGNLVLFQIENEFSGQRTSSGAENWPLISYMQRLEKTSREAGLVIVSDPVLNGYTMCEVLMGLWYSRSLRMRQI